MVKVKWSPNAVKDLKQIYQYLSQDSPEYANNVIMGISAAKNRIIKFPRLGRIVPELNNIQIREILFLPYRIIYEITADCIEIITIIHGNRQLKL